MPLVNDNEEEIHQLQEDVAELQGDVADLKGDVNIINSSISTLQNSMQVAQSDIRENQININLVQSNLNTVTSLVAVNANNILKQTEKISSLTSKNAVLEQGINTLITRSNTLEQGIAELGIRVTALENGSGGNNDLVDLINATVTPVVDVLAHCDPSYVDRVDVRYLKNLQNDSYGNEHLKVFAFHRAESGELGVYSALQKKIGANEYRYTKSNDITSIKSHFLKLSQDFLINNILELSNGGIWGFNLGLDNSFNYVNSTRFMVNDNDDLEIFYLYDSTDPNVDGSYECTIVNNQLSLAKNGSTVLTEDHCDGVFLLKVQGIKLALVIPEIPQNGQFHFDIHSDTPSQHEIHMVHGILLENDSQYYGNYDFAYNGSDYSLSVIFPDYTEATFFNVHRSPTIWYTHGIYKFAFLLITDPANPQDHFNFNYSGVGTNYFDGVQVISNDSNSTLYGYYDPHNIPQTSVNIYYDTVNFNINGMTYPYTEFFYADNIHLLLWTGKVTQIQNHNFEFVFNQ